MVKFQRLHVGDLINHEAWIDILHAGSATIDDITLPASVATTDYVDVAIQNAEVGGVNYLYPVLGFFDHTSYPDPEDGDRIIDTEDDSVYQYVTDAWVEHEPTNHTTVYDLSSSKTYMYSTAETPPAWVEIGLIVDHTQLINKGVMTHAQIDTKFGETDASFAAVDKRVSAIVTPEVYGAVGDGVTDDTTAVNAAIATGQHVYGRMDKLYYAPGTITDPYGCSIDDTVAIKKVDGTQYRSYADTASPVAGREYLSGWYNKLASGSGTNRKILFSGDSTTFGSYSTMTCPDAMAEILLRCGRSNISSLNYGKSGASTDEWVSTYLPLEMAAVPDVWVLRWGINDRIRTLAQFSTSLSTGLATIRADSRFNLASGTSIVIMSPTSIADLVNQSDPVWGEKMSRICMKMARDYNCAYIDTYALARDSINGVTGQWMHDILHPCANFQQLIASAVYDALFPSFFDRVGRPAVYSPAFNGGEITLSRQKDCSFYMSGRSLSCEYNAYAPGATFPGFYIWAWTNMPYISAGKFVAKRGFTTLFSLASGNPVANTGAIRFQLTPAYTGVPAVNQYFVAISNTTGAQTSFSGNEIMLLHTGDTGGSHKGQTYIFITDSAGTTVLSRFSTTQWLPTSGTEYQVELNWDTVNGTVKLFIDGAQFDSTTLGARTTYLGDNLLIGYRTNTSDMSIRHLQVFSTVQHIGAYTPALPATTYIGADGLTTGTGTFTGAAQGIAPTADAHFATKKYVDDTVAVPASATAAGIITAGAQTLAGVKTFSSSPIVPAPTTDLQAATKKYADDVAAAVITSGAQTWAGVKTFSSSPIVPTPTTDYQSATKKYVDDSYSTTSWESTLVGSNNTSAILYFYGTKFKNSLVTLHFTTFGAGSSAGGSCVAITLNGAVPVGWRPAAGYGDATITFVRGAWTMLAEINGTSGRVTITPSVAWALNDNIDIESTISYYSP